MIERAGCVVVGCRRTFKRGPGKAGHPTHPMARGKHRIPDDARPFRYDPNAEIVADIPAATFAPEQMEPHEYVPSVLHAGDCDICGHVADSPNHWPLRPTPQQGQQQFDF